MFLLLHVTGHFNLLFVLPTTIPTVLLAHYFISVWVLHLIPCVVLGRQVGGGALVSLFVLHGVALVQSF